MSRVEIDAILELPPAERLEIVARIWESLDHPKDVPMPAWHREELDRRWAEFQNDPDEGEPWDDVRKALLNE